MGASLAKEMGLYNEEEIILPIVSGNNTPTGPQYRILRPDPRSATSGIKRTPIQVECTPAKKLESGLSLKFDTDESDTIHHEKTENEIDNEIIEVKNEKEELVRKYLETDIDAVKQHEISSGTQSKFSPETDMPLSVSKHPQIITLSTDPRSPPSFEVNRTPIQVECSPGMFSLCSRIDSATLDFSDSEPEDPSVIVSDIGETPISTTKQTDKLKDWFDGIDNSSLENHYSSSPMKSPFNFADRNLMKKQLFLTPENEKSPKRKPRTPLGTIHSNNMVASPKDLLRAKQWRGIEEERSRRGVKLDNENTPPPMPPLTHISSAPGKLIRKKNLADWDCDSTVFI